MTYLTWISEADAEARLGWAKKTLRYKVTATGPYAGKEPLNIRFTKFGKGWRFCLEDIERMTRKLASA